MVIAVATFLRSKGSSDANAPEAPAYLPVPPVIVETAPTSPVLPGTGKSPCIFIEDTPCLVLIVMSPV